jgi:hypothetical protein
MTTSFQFLNCANDNYEKSLVKQVFNAAQSLNKQEWEEFEERSAIMEFEGGLSREEADWRALRIIIENRPRIAV